MQSKSSLNLKLPNIVDKHSFVLKRNIETKPQTLL